MSAQSDTQNTKVGIEQGGDTIFVKSGGTIDMQPGASMKGAGGNTIQWDYFPRSIDIADLSADAVYNIVVPWKGTLKKLWSCIDGAVSTADVTITPIKVGGSAMTGGAITIATAASAAGDVDSSTPSDNNEFEAGDVLRLTVAGGGSGGSPRGHVVAEFQRT